MSEIPEPTPGCGGIAAPTDPCGKAYDETVEHNGQMAPSEPEQHDINHAPGCENEPAQTAAPDPLHVDFNLKRPFEGFDTDIIRAIVDFADQELDLRPEPVPPAKDGSPRLPFVVRVVAKTKTGEKHEGDIEIAEWENAIENAVLKAAKTGLDASVWFVDRSTMMAFEVYVGVRNKAAMPLSVKDLF